MTLKTSALLHAVALAITRRYDLGHPATVEYPDHIAIQERNINDDVAQSSAHWAVGPSLDPVEAATGVWTGQLTFLDGRDCGRYRFAVRPLAGTPEAIADAIYYHGIGECYAGACLASECPRVLGS